MKRTDESYRTYLGQKGQKTKMIPSYGLLFYFFWWCVVWDLQRFQNHQKMNAMETALMQMNSAKDDGNRDTDTGF